MALLHRPQGTPVRHVSRETATPWPGLAMAAGGALTAWCIHRLVPAVPMLTASVVLGIAVAHLPRLRTFVRAGPVPVSPWQGAG